MASYAKAIIVGNLTRDPELTYTPSGKGVCKFGMACNEKYTDASGQKVEKVHFFDITAWGKTGELAAQYLKKGSAALVDGKLSQDRWDDKETGAKRSKVFINAERVVFLGSKPAEGDSTGAAAGAPEAAGVGEEAPF